MKDKVIVIAGPTASGKTSCAVERALRENGEVISADSMQIYKYMDIGTAKPTKEEMKGIKHHLIDFVHPLEEFNVVKYQTLAKECIKDVLKRGKRPIICGGTGLYINSVMYNIDYAETSCDEELRKKLYAEAEKYGAERLHGRLAEIDPKAAGSIHMNNVKRVVRAIEVYELTGKRFSQCVDESLQNPSEYEFEFIFLNPERELLYENINKRVDHMISMGLVEETAFLYEKGYLEGPTSSAGICYKEILPYIKGKEKLEACVQKLKQATRNYAKRQITWFKKVHV